MTKDLDRNEYLQQSYEQSGKIIKALHLEVQMNQLTWELSSAQIGSVYTFYSDFDDAARRLRKTINQLLNVQCATPEHYIQLEKLIKRLKSRIAEFKVLAETVNKDSREHELRPFSNLCLELYKDSQKLPGKVKAPAVVFSREEPRKNKIVSAKKETPKPVQPQLHFSEVHNSMQLALQKAKDVLEHTASYTTEQVYYAEQVQSNHIPAVYKHMQLLNSAPEKVKESAVKLFERQAATMHSELDKLKERRNQEKISPLKVQSGFLREKYRHWLDDDALELN